MATSGIAGAMYRGDITFPYCLSTRNRARIKLMATKQVPAILIKVSGVMNFLKALFLSATTKSTRIMIVPTVSKKSAKTPSTIFPRYGTKLLFVRNGTVRSRWASGESIRENNTPKGSIHIAG